MTSARRRAAGSAAEAEAVEVGIAPDGDAPDAPASGEVDTYQALQTALQADSRPVERVVVTEWPGAPVMYLRGITGHARDEIENTTFGEALNDISAKIVARSLCTPDGKPLVSRGQMAATEQMLTTRSAGGLLHLQRVARRLSGMDQAAIDELEALLSKAQSVEAGTG